MKGVLMDNPSKFLKDYMASHHPKLTLSPTRSYGREHGMELDATTGDKSTSYRFVMMIPRNAPANPKPLCTAVYRGRKRIWQFDREEQHSGGFMKKVRVHLYEFAVDKKLVYLLVKVTEGEPDRIQEVKRVDGTYLGDKTEALLKMHLGKLWGMHVRYTDMEARELKVLMPQKTK